MNEQNQEIKPVRIISDAPVKEKAGFGFDAYINTISDLIAYKENETPLVIGVYGKWGSGKTTLMESIREKLEKDEKYKPGTAASDYRVCKTVWFQAWKYKNEDEILAALIAEIFKEMEKGDFFERLKASAEKLATGTNKAKLIISLIKKITTIDVGEFFQDPEYKKSLGFYNVFDGFFTRLIWSWLSWKPKLYESEEYKDQNGALVVFIDDLDRCPISKIVQVLETIKLFMDKKGCVFVIGAAHDIIIDALKATYKENADRFMDKIVQVTFNLPKIPVSDFTPFLESCKIEFGENREAHLDIIIRAMENNPRNIKRFINDLNLQKGLNKNKGLNIKDKDLLLWNVIEKGYRDFFQELKGDGGFNTLQAMHDKMDEAKDEPDAELNPEKIKDIPEHLVGYFKNHTPLFHIVDQFRPTRQGLEQLITLSGIVELSQKEPVRPKPTGERKMASIPKGNFIYQDNENKTIDYDYEMDIYPVTNELFRKFILAKGYADEKFWDPEGWQWRKKNKIMEPDLWETEPFDDPEQPVVGVSWYEADAYARWLSEFEKEKGYAFRLPSEMEWERAARGDKGNIWPWGNEFDKDKCNCKESGLGEPNRVTVYPNGVSPYGCYDMTGNVWEWTSSIFNKNIGTSALRGGSFSDSSDNCRCARRYGSDPFGRNGDVGFRCARIIKL